MSPDLQSAIIRAATLYRNQFEDPLTWDELAELIVTFDGIGIDHATELRALPNPRAAVLAVLRP